MNNFRIEGLTINKVGPFEKLNLIFPEKPTPYENKAEIHILTGENGTGKTTLLECLIESIPHNNNNRNLIQKFHNQDANISVNFVNQNLFGDDSSLIQFSKTNYPNSIISFSEKLSTNIKNDCAFFAYSGFRKVNNAIIHSITEINSNPSENALNFENNTSSELIFNWIANTKTRESLAFRKNDTVKMERYSRAIKKIELAISEITQQNVKIDLEDDPLAVVFYVEGEKRNLDVLPDGFKSIFSWIADLLMRLDKMNWVDDLDIFERNFILFLDEIDIHLHVAWQRRILLVVQSLFPNAQIFISTHSPFVVGSVDGAYIYKFIKEGQNTILASNYPKITEDALSYDYILEEMFDISTRFGVEVEKSLVEFSTLRNKILNGKITSEEEGEFMKLIHALATQSRELENIVGSELRQIKRITQKDFFETV